eukprot:4635444-Pleurochrysis_carterae.AAC.2
MESYARHGDAKEQGRCRCCGKQSITQMSVYKPVYFFKYCHFTAWLRHGPSCRRRGVAAARRTNDALPLSIVAGRCLGAESETAHRICCTGNHGGPLARQSTLNSAAGLNIGKSASQVLQFCGLYQAMAYPWCLIS